MSKDVTLHIAEVEVNGRAVYRASLEAKADNGHTFVYVGHGDTVSGAIFGAAHTWFHSTEGGPR